MKTTVLVSVLLLVAQSAGWAETRFKAPDTRLIFETNGLADRIVSEEKGIITFDCGVRPEDGQACSFDPATGRIVDRIPLKLVRIPERDAKRYEGLEFAENIYYAAYPCEVAVESTVDIEHETGFVFSYLLSVQPGSTRGVNGLFLPTGEFLDVMEPEEARLLPMQESAFKKGWFFYTYGASDPYHLRNAGKLLRKEGMSIGRFRTGKHQPLQPGDEFSFQMTAAAPPGTLELFASCDWLPDSGGAVPFASTVSEGLSTIFMEPMSGLVVGPRRDLKGLTPAARARKLQEELERFGEAGWVNPAAALEIGEGLRVIADAEGKPEKVRKLVKELVEKVSGMDEERCSVECRSILTVNLDIAARDLAASRAGGSDEPAR